MAMIRSQLRAHAVPLFAPLALGALAFLSSTHWGKIAAERATPVTIEAWEAVLRDQGYVPDRRNAGPMRQDDLSNADVWMWPAEGRVQIGSWTFQHTRSLGRAAPPTASPENIGSGWRALTLWLELASKSRVATSGSPKVLRPKPRIWY